MRSRKLLTLGLAAATFSALAATPVAPRPMNEPLVSVPLLDADGRAAPGNVIGKGDPSPRRPDGGSGVP